jgi:hypothetical protein
LSGIPRVAVSSILTMRSADLTPARKAGVSSIGGNDADRAVLDADLDAEAAELALRGDLEVLERFRVEEVGMRVQPVHHSVDRFLDELFVRDRLDVIALDPAEDRGQQLEVFVGDRRLRLALRDRREIERQQDPEDRAQPDQSRLLPAVGHCVYPLPCVPRQVSEVARPCPAGEFKSITPNPGASR